MPSERHNGSQFGLSYAFVTLQSYSSRFSHCFFSHPWVSQQLGPSQNDDRRIRQTVPRTLHVRAEIAQTSATAMLVALSCRILLPRSAFFALWFIPVVFDFPLGPVTHYRKPTVSKIHQVRGYPRFPKVTNHQKTHLYKSQVTKSEMFPNDPGNQQPSRKSKTFTASARDRPPEAHPRSS